MSKSLKSITSGSIIKLEGHELYVLEHFNDNSTFVITKNHIPATTGAHGGGKESILNGFYESLSQKAKDGVIRKERGKGHTMMAKQYGGIGTALPKYTIAEFEYYDSFDPEQKYVDWLSLAEYRKYSQVLKVAGNFKSGDGDNYKGVLPLLSSSTWLKTQTENSNYHYVVSTNGFLDEAHIWQTGPQHRASMFLVSDLSLNEDHEIIYNSVPLTTITSPTPNQTLYENDSLNITGTASETDIGNAVTIRYQVNANTVRAIKAFVSTGAAEAFGKQLTFKGGSLYDGDTLIASNLTDGTAHTLKVWATDDQGGQSAIVERTFYVVPNRAPRLEVTPPTIEGNIDSDTFTVSGIYADDDKNEVIISYRINGSISKEVARGTDGTFDFTLSLAQLKNGNNTISVEAIDSYGAKTSRTIKLHKNTIATPLLQSTVRYLIQPPKESAQAVLLWLQRDQELAVTASLHMGMKGEAEAFTLLEPTNTAPLRDNATILEDEFYHEANSAKDHIILQLDMLRSSVESTAAIHLISGVFE